jgi:hypothetical protein
VFTRLSREEVRVVYEGVTTSGTASPATLESELRPLLRDVRLIGELDLALEGQVYLQAKSACGPLFRRRDFQCLHWTCPASVALFLVAEGRHRYEGGSFWPNVSLPGISDPNDAAAAGRAFLSSLEALQLETFEQAQLQEHGHRFIMPILLHGGIPHYCAGDVWRLLLEEIRDGADDGDQLVANWRNRPYLISALDKPAQRFLRFGGEFASDLVQRMIDLVDLMTEIGHEEARDLGASALAAETGLPSYLAEALLFLAIPLRRSGPRLPRPRVFLDPYAGEGPSVVLPATGSQRFTQGRWTVTGRTTRNYKTSAFDEQEVPLEPSPQWQVVIDTGAQTRLSSFAGFERAPVYFFDPVSGELLRDQQRLRPDRVLALASRAIVFRCPDSDLSVPEIQELPPLSGMWSTWGLRELDLRGESRFRVVLADPAVGASRDELVFVAAGSARPRLSDPAITGVLDLDGRPVFAHLPRLHVETGTTDPSAWRVRFRAYDHDFRCTLADLRREESDFRLDDVLPSTSLVAGELSILGPLGSDYRTGLTLVPGLQIVRPNQIISPSEHVVITVRASGTVFSNEADQLTLTLPPGEDALSIDVGDGASRFTLLVTVPRLLWAIRKRDAAAASFGGNVLTLGLDEMEAGDAEALLVRVRRTASLQLQLIGDERVLQTTEWVTTGGSDGRWTFPLPAFAQTVAQAGLARLHLRLTTEGLQTDVVAIEARYEVTDIRVDSVVSEAEQFTCCEVSFRENRAFRDREIRLWSRSRPWESPVHIAIDEHDHDSCFFSVDESVPAGPYLLEIAVRNPWLVPTRPGRRDGNVAEVTIGTYTDLSVHLNALDASHPLEALELVISDRQHSVAELEENVAEVFGSVVESLLALLDEWQAEALGRPVYQAVSELAFAEPELLARWLIQNAASRMTREQLLRLAIATLPDILDCLFEALEQRELDNLWSVSAVFGAAFAPYHAGDAAVAACWQYFTGWSPAMAQDDDLQPEESDRLPSRGGGIDQTFVALPPARLRELATMLRPDEVKPLRWIGYLEGAFEVLRETWADRDILERWRSAHSRLNDRRARLEPVHGTYLDRLEPGPDTPGWCRFPQDLLACSFHLVSFSGERKAATSALWAACRFTPTLTERSLLVAVALHRLGM